MFQSRQSLLWLRETEETTEPTEPADPIELICWVNEAHTDIFEYGAELYNEAHPKSGFPVLSISL